MFWRILLQNTCDICCTLNIKTFLYFHVFQQLYAEWGLPKEM